MKKKTNNIGLILLILFLGVVLTTYMVGALYAKYSSSSGSTDDAKVAEFHVDINGTTLSTDSLLIDGLKPGENIDHEIKVNIKSEVAVKCTIKVVTTGSLPLEYKIDTLVLDQGTNTLIYEQTINPTDSTGIVISKTLNIRYLSNGSDNYMESYEVDRVDIIVTIEQID